MRKKILTVFGIGVVLLIGYVSWFLYPWFADPEIKLYMGLPFDWHLRQFQFAKYEFPENYQLLFYRHTHLTPMEDRGPTLEHLLLVENRVTKQLLSLSTLKEVPSVEFSKVTIGEAKLRDSHRVLSPDMRRTADDAFLFIQLRYFLPMLYTKKDITKGRDLILKGMEVAGREEFETEKTKVLLLKGSFTRLGFFKKSPSKIFQYPATGVDFLKPMHGALAVINDKATGKTIFAVGAQETGKPFQEEEFLHVVKSLTFDAEPVKEFVDEMRDAGFEAYTKPGKLKIEFGK